MDYKVNFVVNKLSFSKTDSNPAAARKEKIPPIIVKTPVLTKTFTDQIANVLNRRDFTVQ